LDKPNRSIKSVILVPHYQGPFKILLELGQYLRSREIAEPVFVLYFDGHEEIAARLEEEGIKYFIHRHWRFESIPLLGQAASLYRDMRFSRDLLGRLGAVQALVCSVETHHLEYLLIPILNKRGVNTIVLQWAQTAGREYFRSVRGKDARRGIAHLLRTAIRKSSEKLLEKMMGLRFAASYGHGPAKHFAVMGQYSRELFLGEDVPEEKLVITGHPEMDYLYELSLEARGEDFRSGACKSLGLDDNRPIWILAREAVAHFGLVEPAKDREDLWAVLELLIRKGKEAQVILKLHPRDTVKYYEWVREQFPEVRVVKDCDFYRLVAVCDLFVSQISSTMMWALALDKPVISYDFNNQPYWHYYRDRPGILKADSPSLLEQRLEEITESGFADRQRRDCALARDRYMTFDGRAKERIARLIQG